MGQKIVLAEGFKSSGHFDIFDAGPKYEAKLTAIKAINRVSLCKSIELSEKMNNQNLYIVCNGDSKQFKAIAVYLQKGARQQILSV